jgi:integrase
MINGQEPPKQKFRDSFITVCRAHHLALKTEKSYWHAARNYIKWLGAESAKDLERNPTENFRKFLSGMANEHPDREEGNEGVSASTQNLHFHGVRFLLEKVVGVKLGDLAGIPRAIGHQRIVDVPPDDVANAIVNSVQGKTGLALRTIRGTAGRLNDITRLRVKDLDFRRKLIAIQESKGGKSRLVPMPESLVDELKALVKERDRVHISDLAGGFGWVSMPGRLAKKYPGEEKSLGWQYVFYSDQISQDPITKNFGRYHLMDVTLQRAFLFARRKLKIRRRFTIHSLRHCTAQFWERNRMTRSQIQQLLGHTNSSTTDRYLLSGDNGVPKAPSPI